MPYISQVHLGCENGAKADLLKKKPSKRRWSKGKSASEGDSSEGSTSAGPGSATSAPSPSETQEQSATMWKSLTLGASQLPAITNGEETQLAETQLDVDLEAPKDPDMIRWMKSQPMNSGSHELHEEMRPATAQLVEVVDDSDDGGLADAPAETATR